MAAEYLTVLEIIVIHDTLIDVFGGTEGIRDMGALEAAVFRPQTGYYEDPIAEAAALMESLLQNHPFLDGNKRTAVAAADTHLRLNGLYFAGDPEAAYEFIASGLLGGDLDRAEIEPWLRENSAPL
ncbi:MAG: type II toxin-antitoxin system death-on-curing family toxin [Acidimicrobiia bacterium]